MSEKMLSREYREYYDAASVISQQDCLEEVCRFASLVGPLPPKDVLDLGGGEGRVAVALSRQGHRVTLADITRGYLTQALALAEREKVPLRAVECDIEKEISGFGGRQYDAILFMNVIEHLKNPTAGLENVRCLLKDSGTLFLHTPNILEVRRLIRCLLKGKELVDYYDAANLPDFHFQEYDYLSLEKVLNFVGLKIVRILPTAITLPVMEHFNVYNRRGSRWLSGKFPFFSDTLLVECRKTVPIDIGRQIEYWKEKRLKAGRRKAEG